MLWTTLMTTMKMRMRTTIKFYKVFEKMPLFASTVEKSLTFAASKRPSSPVGAKDVKQEASAPALQKTKT